MNDSNNTTRVLYQDLKWYHRDGQQGQFILGHSVFDKFERGHRVSGRKSNFAGQKDEYRDGHQ